MTESKKPIVNILEIAAFVIFVLGIILIFVSRSQIPDRNRELSNALRFQHVSEIADALWQSSLVSTDFERIAQGFDTGVSCRDKTTLIEVFESVLVPQYFETLPQDPGDGSYFVSVDQQGRITVCAFGEHEDGSSKYISITR